MNLRKPFLIVVTGTGVTHQNNLASGIAELAGTEFFSENELTTTVENDAARRYVLFDLLLARAESCVEAGSSVVLEISEMSTDQMMTLANLANAASIPYQILRCETESKDAGRSCSQNCGFDFPATQVNQLLMEPSLPQPELSLYALRTLPTR